MSKPRVAVLRGGVSSEYEVSMKTGASVLQVLDALHYPAKDIVITKQDEWLDGGLVRSPDRTLVGIDVVFIALHGEHGEDGRVQQFLTHHQIPYTGSRALASATALNKSFTKQLLAEQGVRTPRHVTVNQDNPLRTPASVVEAAGECVVVKPAASGSSIDTFINVPAEEAVPIVYDLRHRYESVLVEEYIKGREVTVGVLEGYRTIPYYLLPVIEILPPAHQSFYTYDAKYGGETSFECPGRVSKSERDQLHEMAHRAHTALDLRHYSRSDFIIRDGVPYFLEVNTLPGLTEHSLFPQGIQAVGGTYQQLVEHLVANAAH